MSGRSSCLIFKQNKILKKSIYIPKTSTGYAATISTELEKFKMINYFFSQCTQQKRQKDQMTWKKKTLS